MRGRWAGEETRRRHLRVPAPVSPQPALTRLLLNRRGRRKALQTRFPRCAHAQPAPAWVSPSVSISFSLSPPSPRIPYSLSLLPLTSFWNPSPSLQRKTEKESRGWNAPWWGHSRPLSAPGAPSSQESVGRLGLGWEGSPRRLPAFCPESSSRSGEKLQWNQIVENQLGTESHPPRRPD